MRILRIVILVSLPLLLTSCIDIIEELSLRKNGSGTYKLTMDLAGMMEQGSMMRSMLESMSEEEKDDNPLFDSDMEKDTLIEAYDIAMANPDGVENPEFWKKVTMRSKMSGEEEEFFVTFNLDFDDIKDIQYFYEHMDEIGEEDEEGGGPGTNPMSNEMFFSDAAYSLGKKRLIRGATTPDKEMMEGDEAAMMKMMMAGATYTSIYHMPGRIKKATIQGAEVDGKTVTVTHSMIELMEGKANLEGFVQYK